MRRSPRGWTALTLIGWLAWWGLHPEPRPATPISPMPDVPALR